MLGSLKSKLLMFSTGAMLTTVCGQGTESSSKINLDATKMTYDIDPRTGVCISAIGIESQVAGYASNITSMTCVPCTEQVLQLANQQHVMQAKANCIVPVR